MGIKKEIELNSGVVVRFWEVQTINLNVPTKALNYRVFGYITKQACIDGKDPAKVIEDTYNIADMNTFLAIKNKNILEITEELVLSNPIFTGSTQEPR